MKNRIDIGINTDNEEYDNILNQNIELTENNEKLDEEVKSLKNEVNQQKDMNCQLMSRSADKIRQIRQLQESHEKLQKEYNELKENQYVLF